MLQHTNVSNIMLFQADCCSVVTTTTRWMSGTFSRATGWPSCTRTRTGSAVWASHLTVQPCVPGAGTTPSRYSHNPFIDVYILAWANFNCYLYTYTLDYNFMEILKKKTLLNFNLISFSLYNFFGLCIFCISLQIMKVSENKDCPFN